MSLCVCVCVCAVTRLCQKFSRVVLIKSRRFMRKIHGPLQTLRYVNYVKHPYQYRFGMNTEYLKKINFSIFNLC